MTDPIISVLDAKLLAASVPDCADSDGGTRRATAIEIVRCDDGWKVQIPRYASFTLQSGKTIYSGLSPLSFTPEQVADAVVTLTHQDGRSVSIPVILAHAILGALYVALENGTIIPTEQQEVIK